MKNNKLFKNKRGQTLVLLLIFILVAITIATTSVSVIISNAQSTSGAAQTMQAYYAAEAGVENATLQLLRNPDYTGETIQISQDESVTVVVVHNGEYTVTSTGQSGNFTRILQAKLDYTGTILSVISWQELSL